MGNRKLLARERLCKILGSYLLTNILEVEMPQPPFWGQSYDSNPILLNNKQSPVGLVLPSLYKLLILRMASTPCDLQAC